MGVRVKEMTPESRMAPVSVRANSLNRRPTMPLMNRMGMNTATSETVMARMVKPISFEPLRAAARGCSPCSTWRTMFSSMTMASSTTKPVASVRAISERLSRLKPSSRMIANVATIDAGRARLGMRVARAVRRKK
ncbi:hypothetical protein D3C87_1804510 [compost metagenome]